MLHPERLGVDLVLDQRRSDTPRGGFTRLVPILAAAAFIQMDQLLVANEQVTDVHISMRSASKGRERCCWARTRSNWDETRPTTRAKARRWKEGRAARSAEERRRGERGSGSLKAPGCRAPGEGERGREPGSGQGMNGGDGGAPRWRARCGRRVRNTHWGTAHRLPNVFPQRGQAQAKGFSFVCVLSCRWTCSTRLIRGVQCKPICKIKQDKGEGAEARVPSALD